MSVRGPLMAAAVCVASPVCAFGSDRNIDDNPAPGITEEPEQILVTARKTDEKLIDAPIAVSVVDAEFFETTGFTRIDEVAAFVPGFDLSPLSSPQATSAKIRGFSTFSFSDGFESSVATVIDGVVQGRELLGFVSLFDVAQVEVLKGPQGTLFGKNAAAGVINIRTRDPEFSLSGNGDLALGSDGLLRIRTAVNAPLSQNVALRVSGMQERQNGYLTNRLPDERPLNERDAFGVRGKLRFVSGNDLQIDLSVDHSERDENCCAPVFRDAGEDTPLIDFATNEGVLQLSEALDRLGIEASPENRAVGVEGNSTWQLLRTTGGSGSIRYRVGGATITSITGWRDWRLADRIEPDGLAITNVANLLATASTGTQFTQEVRVDGRLLQSIEALIGLLYFDQTVTSDTINTVELALPVPPFFNVETRAASTVTSRSGALFGEATVALSERLSVIAGARLTFDEVEADYERAIAPINEAFAFGPIFGPAYIGSERADTERLSLRGIARYEFSPLLTGYATWSSGYKGPGIDVALTTDTRIDEEGSLPVLPEEISELIEVGVKGSTGNLFFDLAVFDQNISDVQTIQTDDTGALTNLSIDRVEASGVEVETFWRRHAKQGFSASLAVSYLDIEIASFAERPDLAGQRFRDNPRWTFAGTADYRHEIGPGSIGFVRAEITGRSGKNSSTELASFAQIEGHTLFNLRAGSVWDDGRRSIIASVNNLFDKHYVNYIYGSPYRILDGRTSSQFVGEPRQLTVMLRFAL